MSDTVPAMIAGALAAPKTHKVITTYADGSVRQFATRSLQTAENHAVLDRRNVGRDLMVRGTDEIVRIVKVEVVEISPALTLAAEIVRIWTNWSDENEIDSEIALRNAAKAVRSLDLSKVDGTFAQSLNYFAGAHLDDDNPEDLTICEMVESLQLAISLGMEG